VLTDASVAAPPKRPTASTGPARSIGATSATLTGTVNPKGAATTWFFQYGATTAYGSQTGEQSAGSGTTNVPVSAAIGGLTPNTTYHYRLVARSSLGTTNGHDRSFKTSANAVTITAKPNPVVFGNATVISGRVSGPGSAGVEVRLEQQPWPYTAAFKQVGSAQLADAMGRYSFTVTPPLNTRYRVVAKTKPPATSAVRLERVRIRVSLRLSTATPTRGRLVRFFGSAKPPHDGRLVQIQRRSSSGRFVTVARTSLRHFSASRSVYRKRLRIFRSGVYRVRVPHDADHATGFSARRRITVR
jgi:hypothetical protein